MVRDIRFTVPLCIVLICGSFAACALLQMRLDHSHALNQAAAFAQERTSDIAIAAGHTLDGYARAGTLFAAGPQQYRSADFARAEPAIRDIAVFDTDSVERLDAASQAAVAAPVFSGARAIIPGGLAFREGSRIIAVWFDPKGLVPAHTALAVDPEQGSIRAIVPGWPVFAITNVDTDKALESWTGALPLYLFVILGPALAGGWLAAIFVGAFERHARAARAIRALKSTRPVEARLMVRLANAERGAAEALRSKSEFIAHMSHELRTPLNAVIGFSEVIADGLYGPAGHPKYTEYARDIGDAGRDLHAKIGDVLEFANIEAGRYPLVPSPVNLCEVALAGVEEHKGRAFSRRIHFDIGVAETVMVRADALALKRVLANLIDNALRYTAEGGTVHVDVRAEEGAGLLQVRDSGAGFSQGERGIAGKPFLRFDRAGTVTGAGLGLAIAMELARRMGGTIQLASEPGRGAIMEVRLPRL
ncbi:MAG TPA: HAMP domain-containing sensor histidine kinase [Rhizomicrobium sp.]|jgi:signal transduction histidine kinase